MSSEGEGWIPRTGLGKLVQAGKITSIEDIFAQGYRIVEPEIVDALLPGLEVEVLDTGLVQKQTDAGEKGRFRAIVAIGNRNGWIGLGSGKAKQWRTAIEKATLDAKLNIIPVRRGCGSRECACDQPHSLPFKVKGKCGSVTVELIPGPRGLGLVASEGVKTVLQLTGIRDIWTRAYGSTRTRASMVYATFDALRETFRVVTPQDWAT
ncbi:MAG: 30S ribosomal protein S5 [Candidatus Bathyarchaeia archaeon]